MPATEPRLIVYTTVFPSSGSPGVGLFIRERAFRVGKRLPLVVVSPVPWFPGQSLLRRIRPHFRPRVPYREIQQGVEMYFPRFLSFPGFFKELDGVLMAIASFSTLYRLRRQFAFNIIDAHFSYPDGYAATLLGRWFNTPVTITMRGTEVPISLKRIRRQMMLSALKRAMHVFSVSSSLKNHVEALGADPSKIQVVGNGVDTDKFRPIPKQQAREQLGLPSDAKIIISVGGLVERKGFHRVIELLPALNRQFPNLYYLIVGGGGPEGDWQERLEEQVRSLRLDSTVKFLGTWPADKLNQPLSCADVFVLATSNEGWANVLLEAMACGLPVVATDVGGNREVVCAPELGTIVPFGDPRVLKATIAEALIRKWDNREIIAYARRNTWEARIDALVTVFWNLANRKAETKPSRSTFSRRA